MPSAPCHNVLQCKMAAICQASFQLRLSPLEKNKKARKKQRKSEEEELRGKKEMRASREELGWIECERSNQVQLGSGRVRGWCRRRERWKMVRCCQIERSQRSPTSLNSAAENALSNDSGFLCFCLYC